MVQATFANDDGDLVEVLVLSQDKAAKTAAVSPVKTNLGRYGDGQFWRNAPVWTVPAESLFNVRGICWEHGTEFDPDQACPECPIPVDMMTDEQATEDTLRGLAVEYAGGML